MFRCYTLTNPGDRPNNEDAAGWVDCGDWKILAVADGLGGCEMGEKASELVLEKALHTEFLQEPFYPEAYIRRALSDAQRQLVQEQQIRGQRLGMKSTAAVAIIDKDTVTVGHVGDSRVYVFPKRGKIWRTFDHSVPQMLALGGALREKEIRHHPARNQLLRVLGDSNQEKVEIDVAVFSIRDVRAVLLCTDGFWEYINERQMRFCLRHAKTPSAWLERMEKQVLRSGKKFDMDNYSAVAAYL